MKRMHQIHVVEDQRAESCDIFMLKQFQTLYNIKTVLLCDSDLKYNYFTSIIKTHRKLLTINHLEAH